jgi:putative ABC transport system permease protein
MALYLALKEIWRARGRFLLVSMVIALITMLVLFVAGLAEGLGAGNREYLEKLNADLVVYQANTEVQATTSRIGASKLNALRRIEGVKDVGPVGFSNASILWDGAVEPLNVSLIGVEPGRPGEPPVVQGEQLRSRRAPEVIIDGNVAVRTGIEVGDTITIKAIQGTEEQFYPLRVVGIADGRQYFLQPSIILPYRTWDKVRPQGGVGGNANAELIANIAAVQLNDPAQWEMMAARIHAEAPDFEAVDRVTAYESTPGYAEQQRTLDTQRYFALLIGILVIGGFFQILTLQKIAQIGMLKAIGASNRVVGLASILQIIAVTAVGVALGAVATLLLSFGFPPSFPIVFTPQITGIAVLTLLLIGPIGGLVSVRYSLRVEPLTALGLAQ